MGFRKCAHCKIGRALYAPVGTKPAIACGKCVQEQGLEGYTNVVVKRCEHCKIKYAAYGPKPTDGKMKKTHCGACNKVLGLGLVCLTNMVKPSICSACKMPGNLACWGLAGTRGATHCDTCVKGLDGFTDRVKGRCVVCKSRKANWSKEGTRSKTHCATCIKDNGLVGFVDTGNIKCVHCKKQHPSLGKEGTRARTHCKSCVALLKMDGMVLLHAAPRTRVARCQTDVTGAHMELWQAHGKINLDNIPVLPTPRMRSKNPPKPIIPKKEKRKAVKKRKTTKGAFNMGGFPRGAAGNFNFPPSMMMGMRQQQQGRGNMPFNPALMNFPAGFPANVMNMMAVGANGVAPPGAPEGDATEEIPGAPEGIPPDTVVEGGTTV